MRVVVGVLSLMIVHHASETARSLTSPGLALGLRPEVTAWPALIVSQGSVVHHSLRAGAHNKVGKILVRPLSQRTAIVVDKHFLALRGCERSSLLGVYSCIRRVRY